ncbi:MAG: hypothetical protein NTY01_24940 [Verrucomicrobia bacterium]|nr:hypothetical protein [Verrucomicrobiota bacterium]
MNRRQFLQTTTGAALLAGSPLLFAAAKPSRRKPPFRVLFSNDTTNIVSCTSPWHKKGEPFRAEMLEATVDEVAGTGVEAHLLQPGVGWIPWWKSKVYPAEEHYRWFKERTGLDPDSFGKYMLAGGDMVKVFIERCRKRGQTPFISLRMNDGHHLENADVKDRRAIWASKFYVEHPEYRLGPDPAKWEQHVLNWAIPEVRAHKFSFIRELCENYDLDGFEMDFMRHYSYFQLDKTTSEQRRSIMTEFTRQVRALLDRTARDGKRRWLCARVPAYTSAHDALGFDLPAMVEAGLDMVNLSASYFTVQQTDLAAIRRSVPQAAVYLEMCHSIWNGRKPPGKGYDIFPFRRATPEQFYTAAHLAYARGGDGVSAFNFVYYREHGGPDRGPFADPPFHIFKHLGDRKRLARQPQHWFLASGWGNPFAKPPVLPRKMAAGQTEAFTLDLAPPSGGWRRAGRLRIQGEDSLGESRWTARLNGEPLTPTDDVSEPYPNPYPPMLGKPDVMRAWTVPPALLCDGSNKLEFALKDGPRLTLAYLDLAMPAGDAAVSKKKVTR